MKDEINKDSIHEILKEIKRLENMICDLLNVNENSSDMSQYLDKAAKNFSGERAFGRKSENKKKEKNSAPISVRNFFTQRVFTRRARCAGRTARRERSRRF